MALATMTSPPTFPLSERLQLLIDPASPPPAICCSNCRARPSIASAEENGQGTPSVQLFRCTRCLAAHYCGRTCQKNHFAFHKKNCKFVAREKQSAQELVDDEFYRDTDRAWTACGNVASTYLRMGFMECDTTSNATPYYQQALYWFWKLYTGSDNWEIIAVNIFFCVFLVGGSDVDFEDLLSTMQKYCTVKLQSRPEKDIAWFEYRYHFLLLLATMRRLANLRQQAQDNPSSTTEKEVLEATTKVHTVLERLKQTEFYKEDSSSESDPLMHFKNSIPYLEEYAPNLFSWMFDVSCFWQVLQDACFTTPGFHAVLDEFIPDEEENDDHE